MDIDVLITLLKENGYVGLFLWLWLGMFGVPIPNEVIVSTIGVVSSVGILHPIKAFLITYCGMAASLTTGYVVGRFIGQPVLSFLTKREKTTMYVNKGLQLIHKHHSYSLCISYFLPGVRNMVPFLFGFSKLPFSKFALFAYSTAFVWLSMMFSFGYFFAGNFDVIVKHYGVECIVGLLLLVMIGYVGSQVKRKGYHDHVSYTRHR